MCIFNAPMEAIASLLYNRAAVPEFTVILVLIILFPSRPARGQRPLNLIKEVRLESGGLGRRC